MKMTKLRRTIWLMDMPWSMLSHSQLMVSSYINIRMNHFLSIKFCNLNAKKYVVAIYCLLVFNLCAAKMFSIIRLCVLESDDNSVVCYIYQTCFVPNCYRCSGVHMNFVQFHHLQHLNRIGIQNEKHWKWFSVPFVLEHIN